jgi:hypothetical protein
MKEENLVVRTRMDITSEGHYIAETLAQVDRQERQLQAHRAIVTASDGANI